MYESIVRVGCSFLIKRNPRVVDVAHDFRSLSKLMNSFVPKRISKVRSKTKAMLEVESIDSLQICRHFLCCSLSTFVDIVDYTSEGSRRSIYTRTAAKSAVL